MNGAVPSFLRSMLKMPKAPLHGPWLSLFRRFCGAAQEQMLNAWCPYRWWWWVGWLWGVPHAPLKNCALGESWRLCSGGWVAFSWTWLWMVVRLNWWMPRLWAELLPNLKALRRRWLFWHGQLLPCMLSRMLSLAALCLFRASLSTWCPPRDFYKGQCGDSEASHRWTAGFSWGAAFWPWALLWPALFGALCFSDSLWHARFHTQYDGEVPKVKVFADGFNKVEVNKKLADSGRLVPILADSRRGAFSSDLFAVTKDLQRDCMVLDGWPANLLEPQNLWSQTMASPTALTMLWLKPHHVPLASGEDPRDFF